MKSVKINSNPASRNWQAPDEVPVEGTRRVSGAGTSSGNMTDFIFPNPEVREKKARRNFTASYKLRILQEVDKCNKPGQIGRLLRREGLYSSHLTTWRRARDKGILQAMKPRKRGRKPKTKNPLTSEVARLQKENQKLENKLKQAQLIIEAQKKISQILGITQTMDENNGTTL